MCAVNRIGRAGGMPLLVATILCVAWVPGAAAQTLYTQDFATLNDLTVEGGAALSVGPAPGGKSGNALRISNPENAGSSAARLTPSGVGTLADGVTVVARLYIDAYTGSFQGCYNYAPGEGLVIRSDGSFGHSWGGILGVNWQEDTWYTIGQVLVDGGDVDIYIKEGAAAELNKGDFAGSVSPAAGRPMTNTVFFNNGGELYVADYSITQGDAIPPAPVLNDNCANAEVITGGTYVGSTDLATPDGTASCGDSDTTPDVWYSYTAVNSGEMLLLDLCGSNFDTVISVHTACPGSAANEIASGCNDDCVGTPCGGAASCLSMPTSLGTTYLIRVSGLAGSLGRYVLNVTPTAMLANDACAAATAITDGPLSGTTVAASNDGEGSCGDTSTSPDVWYDYTATCSDHLRVKPGNATFDPTISIHNGCPGGGSELGCLDPAGVDDTLSIPVTASNNYLIRVSGPGGTSGDFNLDVSCGPAPSGLPYTHDFTDLHDLVAEAGATLSVGPAPGGKSGSALRISNPDNVGYSWAQLTPTLSAPLPDSVTVRARLYIDSHTAFQGFYNYAPAEGLVIRDDGTFGDSSQNSFGVPWQEDTWYTVALVLLDGGGFSVYIAEGADVVLSTGDLKGVAAGSGRPMTHSIFFNYGGELYVADYSIEEGSTIPDAPPPPNDDCVNAEVATDGTVAGTTAGATNDGDASCGGTGLAPDIWYAYTATCSDHLVLRVTDASFSPVSVSVHTGCPGSLLNELACEADAVANLLSTRVAANNTYWIRVSTAGAVGPFTLNIRCGEPPPPPPTTLYCHDFTSLVDLTAVGAAVLLVGPAPGGKSGNALHISNPGNVGSSYADLIPTGIGTLPNVVTTVFRMYIDSRADFQAVYNYSPGEGLRFLAGGGLQGSCGESLPGSWQEDTWYTVALVLNSGGGINVYAKEGADATLDGTADLLGTICGNGRPLSHTIIFNYGGEMYVSDYVINKDVNFSFCTGPCNDPFADVDGDGDVDEIDFGLLQLCYSGPAGPVAEGCECLDHDLNGAVDGFDVQAFVACGSGPTVPANPACDD